MEDLLVNIAILAVFLFFSGLFSSIETAFYSIDRFKVKRLLKKKRKGALQVYNLKQHPTRFLVTILLLNNVVNIGAASFSTAVVLQAFPGNMAIAISTFGITFLVLIFGEITPKALATKHATKLMLATSGLMSFFVFVLAPITILMEKFATLVVGSHKKESLTEEEVRMIVSLGVEEGAIDQEERELIHNVFTLDDTAVEEIMTPRVEVISIESDKTLLHLKSFFRKNPYSKIPVYDDEIDNIVGIFNVRKAFDYLGKKLDVKVGTIMEDPFFVPTSKKIGDLLREFQEKKVHIAIVVDEYGSFMGVVTLEDILEELVGEITEDKDDELEMKIVNEKTIIVEGATELDTVNEELNLNLSSENFNTVAGFILEKLDRLPEKGETIKIAEATFDVLEVSNTRIEKVKITSK